MANTVNAFPIIAAPLFILMGNILNAAQVTNRIVTFSKSLLGWTRGGLAHASVLASAIFAGMCGSAVADAAGVGSIEIKAMKDAGYRPELAASISAASATIGPIVPPSLPLVIYGVTADVSVGALFLAGMIPGLMMAISLMTMVAVIAKRHGLPAHPFLGLRGIWAAFREAFGALLTPVILLGGILSGTFTPTEGAAVAATYALFLGLFVYRTLTLRDLPGIIVQSAETVGVVLALVMTAGALGWCLSISRVPQTIAPALVAAIHDPRLFLVVCVLILLAVGCFMEVLAAMLILIPILTPVAAQFGIDARQFGVIFVFTLVLGTIHPPVGVVIFITSRIAGISFETMSRAVLPWLVPLLVVLGLIVAFPPLTTFMPKLVLGR
jgi:tripartite ATP-independent transporter DctM subunit